MASSSTRSLVIASFGGGSSPSAGGSTSTGTIDVGIAFQGLISLMNEQREKVEKASSDEEESRYSQPTMVDLQMNDAAAEIGFPEFTR